MVENVIVSAIRELLLESFLEWFSPAYALLVDEEPGALFCGTLRRAEFLGGIHVYKEFVIW